MTRITMVDYPWAEVERTKAFITRLFSGPAPDRPAALVHPSPPPAGTPAAPPPPSDLPGYQRDAWQAIENLKRRPMGRDDFVPTLGTGAGTCAMATAFGAAETQQSGVYWVAPCITNPSEIDRMTKPPVTAGRLGNVLAQTRAYAECADERLPIRIMDFQSPFTTVEQMLGSDVFFTMPYDEPGRLKALMSIVTDFAIDFFKAQMAAAGPNWCPGIWPPIWFPKCAGIQMADDNLVNVSPEIYEEFVVPYNSRIAGAFGGMFLHSCTIKEPAVAAVKKIKGLTGINCDISTSVSVELLLREFGRDIVVAPHAYINTDTNFQSYEEYMRAVIAPWRPGHRLFVYPCSVLYLPNRSVEIRFNEAEARRVLEEIPAWKRDRG